MPTYALRLGLLSFSPSDSASSEARQANRHVQEEDDRQVREEDEKGKLTDSFEKRMKRQADRQVWKEDEKAS